MKKLVLLLLVISIVFLLSSCDETPVEEAPSKRATQTAILLMPDGSIIQGVCTNLKTTTRDWTTVTIDGVTYMADQRRLVIIETTEGK